jgi:hypothetical protein
VDLVEVDLDVEEAEVVTLGFATILPLGGEVAEAVVGAFDLLMLDAVGLLSLSALEPTLIRGFDNVCSFSAVPTAPSLARLDAVGVYRREAEIAAVGATDGLGEMVVEGTLGALIGVFAAEEDGVLGRDVVRDGARGVAVDDREGARAGVEADDDIRGGAFAGVKLEVDDVEADVRGLDGVNEEGGPLGAGFGVRAGVDFAESLLAIARAGVRVADDEDFEAVGVLGAAMGVSGTDSSGS